MGTRHLQTVIAKDGQTKINQYGQWDGYPSGQGLAILKYLKSGNLEQYQKNLKKIKWISKKQINEVNKTENWQNTYPFLSRDCGSDIHKMIEEGKVPFVSNSTDSEFWCEGFYTIDFQKGIFTSEYHGRKKSYKLDKLPTQKAYLKALKNSDEEE